jgi:hypothetical protein
MNDERPLISIKRCDLCTERHCNGCKEGSNFDFRIRVNLNIDNDNIHYEEQWRRPWIDNIDPRGAQIGSIIREDRSRLYTYSPPAERIVFPDDGYTIWGQRALNRQNGSDNEE